MTDHQYNSNHDSKAEKYFESVRKEKDTETFSSGSKRYRGFKPILDYRPPIRTKSTSTSQRTRDAGEDDQSNDHESSKGRNKNRSKKITYQEEEEEYQDDAEHPRSNEGQRSKAPAVPYQHDRVGRKRPTVVPAEEPEYEEPSEERLPTIQGRSRSNHKEAHSFDYDDDLDDPYADRLKAMNHPDDGSNSANTVSTTHGTNEDSFTNDSKAYVKDANRESNHAESSSDQKLQNRSDTDGQTESSEKRESTTTLAAKHFASRSTGNVKGPTRKARQLGKAKKRWSNSELAEQTVDLLHLDQDKEEAGDEEFDVDDHRSKNGRLDVGLRAWKSAEKGTASSEAAKSRPRTKSDSQSKTWGPNDWSLFDDTVSTDSKKNWRQKSKSWKRNKMANRRSLFDRVYDEDNTDSIGQTMYKNF